MELDRISKNTTNALFNFLILLYSAFFSLSFQLKSLSTILSQEVRDHEGMREMVKKY